MREFIEEIGMWLEGNDLDLWYGRAIDNTHAEHWRNHWRALAGKPQVLTEKQKRQAGKPRVRLGQK